MDAPKRFRATVKHDGQDVGDLPWLEEFWAVRYDDHAAEVAELKAQVARLTAERDEVAEMKARIAELEAEAERRDEQISDMIEASGQKCACGYDKASDVCLGHLSHFRKSLTAERDAAYERAAKVSDEWVTDQQRQFGNGGPAAAIRALKDQ